MREIVEIKQGTSLSKRKSEDEDDSNVGISSTLDMFQEYNEVSTMIKNIPETSKTFITAEKGFEDIKTLLDQYQVRNLTIKTSNLIHLLIFISGATAFIGFSYSTFVKSIA